MVIVITGTSIALNNQSEKRLRKDLGLAEGSIAWRHFSAPRPNSKARRDVDEMRAVLKEWNQPEFRDESRTVLITVMKQHVRLHKLAQALGQLDLTDVPTLIIDDEADHAGLNTRVRSSEESAVYEKLNDIRAAAPRHTYLQYTATPQGPLFIDLGSPLSPDFAELLRPGGDYTGGKEFFGEGADLRRLPEIPNSELPDVAMTSIEPPESLKRAMRQFYIGVASGRLRGDFRNPKKRRSMMIHPNQKVDVHDKYYEWVTKVREFMLGVLECRDADRDDLLADFREDYDDLKQTAPDLEPFELIQEQLYASISKSLPRLINSTDQAQKIVWEDSYAWILVGGQALDRGFTVEGLTVTYMPRGRGIGNVDTIQQRARCFGYHRPYFGLCRVFLEAGVLRTFQEYVVHEENMRRQLEAARESGISLVDLNRNLQLLLNRNLNPTRASIQTANPVRASTAGWSFQQKPHLDAKKLKSNQDLLSSWISSRTDWIDESRRGEHQSYQHMIARAVPLDLVVREVLEKYYFSDAQDEFKFRGIFASMRHYLEKHPGAACSVAIMDPPHCKSRRRGLVGGEIKYLFQGRSQNQDATKGSYPGDAKILGEEPVTIHFYRVSVAESTESNSRVVAEDVPVLAIFLSDEVAQDVVARAT
jgi:hypothetical protein